ncbi:MAG: DUF5074 domain-containing protein [Bacteroidales bacterium]
MKRLLCFLPVVVVLFSCNNNDDEPTPEVSSDSDQVLLDYRGNAKTITINSEEDWTATTDADWLTLSQNSGTGSVEIEISASKNDETSERSTQIIISNVWQSEFTITVRQSKTPETVGMYILSEGNWGSFQAELAYYDFSTGAISQKYYGTQNGGAVLGDTGNALAIYGSKMYCIVSGKDMTDGGYIQMLDPKTGIAGKRIEVTNSEGEKVMPRKITFYENKAYITTYSGEVARLDTASLTIDGRVKLSGTFPEGICQYKGKLYVCNSGKGTDSTISVVDIASFNEEKTITVPMNPVDIVATAKGDIYFTTATLYWSTGKLSNLHLLDAETEMLVKTFDIRASRLALGDDYLYTVENETDWSTYETVDYTYKVDLETKESSIFSKLKDYFMMYNVSVNPVNGDVYIGGQGQDVAILGQDGVLKTYLETGTGFTNTIVPIFN